MTRLGELSWQQLADNEDVVMLAPPDIKKSTKMSKRLTTHTACLRTLAEPRRGIRHIRPLEGEPAIYEDPQDHPRSDGETLELVSVMPGPVGSRYKDREFYGRQQRAWESSARCSL